MNISKTTGFSGISSVQASSTQPTFSARQIVRNDAFFSANSVGSHIVRFLGNLQHPQMFQFKTPSLEGALFGLMPKPNMTVVLMSGSTV